MALDNQIIPINFQGGVDTKTDPKQVVMSKLITMENGRLISPKRVQKRNGYSAFVKTSSGGTISAGVTVAEAGSEIVMGDGSNLYSYSPSRSLWQNKGAFQSIDVASKYLPGGRFDSFGGLNWKALNFYSDMAVHSGGLVCVASLVTVTAGASFAYQYTILDSSNWQTIVPATTVASFSGVSSKPRVLVVGTNFVYLYQAGPSGALTAVTISVASPTTVSAPTTIGADINITFQQEQSWDAVVLNNLLYVSYRNTTPGITFKSYNSSLTLQNSGTNNTEDAPNTMTTLADATLNQIWVLYGNGTNLRYIVRSSTLTAVLANTTIEANTNPWGITGYVDNGSGVVYYGGFGLNTINNITSSVSLTNLGVVTLNGILVRSVSPSGKLFRYNGTNYLLLFYSGLAQGSGAFCSSDATPTQSTFFIWNTALGKVVGKLQSGAGAFTRTGTVYGQYEMMPQSFILPSGNQAVVLMNAASEAYPGTSVGVIDVLSFSSLNNYLNIQGANNLLYSGGVVFSYDGNNICEQNFFVGPELPPSHVGADGTGSYPGISTSTTGGAIQAGTYYYVATYDFIDSKGQTQSSLPSIPSLITTTGTTSTNTIVVPMYKLGSKVGTVLVRLWRTTVNGVKAGPYYFIASGTNDGITLNTITFTDILLDSTITASGSITLYTGGSVVPNGSPPPTPFMVNYRDRVFALNAENRNQLWYSQQISQGIALEFSANFTWNVDPFGGDVTGMATMDDKLVLFKNRVAGFMTGDGPSPSGAQNDFTPLTYIPTSQGCINQRSVCVLPDGILHQTNNGWYLLERSLRDVYIGADVEAYNARTTESTTLIPNSTEVRIILDNGTCLVYDYFLNQWYTFTNHSAVQACIYQNLFTYANSSGLVLQEAPGTYTDNGAAITMKLVTPWLQPSQIQGLVRARELVLLGSYYSNHTLNIQLAYNFNSTPTQTTTFSVSGSVIPYQYRVHFAQQKCEAVQVTIYDSNQAGSGQSFDISALSFIAGMKKGLYRLPATQTG